MKSYRDTIQSLDRGLQILDYLSKGNEYVSLSELTSHIKLDKSTVYRIMKTLLGRGYARQDKESRKYSLGFRIFDLSHALSNMLSLEKEGTPFLKDLMGRTGESAHLAILFEGMATFVSRENSSEVLAINTEVGRREPLHCTSLGKVLLAYLPVDEFKGLIDNYEFKKFTKNTITEINDLREEIDKVRIRGYAIDNEEYKPGVRCIASPVYNADGIVIAAMGISGPSSRMTKKKLPELAKTVSEVGANLSSALGFSEK